MSQKKTGTSTVRFSHPPSVIASAAVAGTKEGDGPLAKYYDKIIQDDLFGEKTWEKAESKLQKTALTQALEKADIGPDKLDFCFAGDLLNQCCATHYAIKDFPVPLFGLYGACSTMAESLALAAMAIDGGFASMCAAVTSSHFCASEKQYRYPLEYGGQRPPTSQWTVTGAGAVILASDAENCPKITHATVGKIADMGITDANNMGAAMAPAAADTVITHFRDTGFSPSDYDYIFTGDLAEVGSEIARELLAREGFDISPIHSDCGCMVFGKETQDVHSGGSGCGCSAIVLCGYILDLLKTGKAKRIMLAGTGALMSPINVLQGESIPSIAHAVTFER